jgi:DNA-binding MarR family transcriptional regulator
MERVPVVRLLSMAVTVALDELHTALAEAGHPTLRPMHGYALNAVHNGHTTASELAPLLAMTKQGAAKVVQTLLDEGYLAYGEAPADDSRRKPLTLTDRGRDAVRTSERIQERIERTWAELTGERQMASARRALEAVVAASASDAGPPPARRGW